MVRWGKTASIIDARAPKVEPKAVRRCGPIVDVFARAIPTHALCGLLLGLGLFACSATDAALQEPCATAKMPNCDVTSETCQARVFRRTQCVREADDVEVPAVRVIDEAKLRDILSQP